MTPSLRRLQRNLRYRAGVWSDATLKERGEYIVRRPLYYLLLCCGGFLIEGAIALQNRAKRCGRVGNIVLVDGDAESGEPFGRVTTEALHLIEHTDPRRFRRLQREVRVIENRAMRPLGTYSRSERKCEIHFSHLPRPLPNDPDRSYSWCLARYAAVLIHEATHGHIDACGIPYTRRTRVTIECLCVREEHRFALRLFGGDRERADKLVPPFDANKWETSWALSSWQRVDRDRQVAGEEARKREERKKAQQERP